MRFVIPTKIFFFFFNFYEGDANDEMKNTIIMPESQGGPNFFYLGKSNNVEKKAFPAVFIIFISSHVSSFFMEPLSIHTKMVHYPRFFAAPFILSSC